MVRCSICVVGCSMFEIEQVSERELNRNWEIQSETERTWKVNKVQETCVSVIELLNISQNEQWFDCFCTHINTIIGMQLNTQISLALPPSLSLTPPRNSCIYHEKVYVFEEKPQSTNKARLFLSHFWSFSFTGSGFGLTHSRNYWEIVWWVCREFLYRMSLRLCFFGAGAATATATVRVRSLLLPLFRAICHIKLSIYRVDGVPVYSALPFHLRDSDIFMWCAVRFDGLR